MDSFGLPLITDHENSRPVVESISSQKFLKPDHGPVRCHVLPGQGPCKSNPRPRTNSFPHTHKSISLRATPRH